MEDCSSEESSTRHFPLCRERVREGEPFYGAAPDAHLVAMPSQFLSRRGAPGLPEAFGLTRGAAVYHRYPQYTGKAPEARMKLGILCPQ